MSRAAQRQQYAAADAARARFERKYAARVRKALAGQARDAILALENGIGNPEAFVTAEPIERLFDTLYTDTGSWFAKRAYRQVSGMDAKDAASDLMLSWLGFMRGFVQNEVGDRITRITATSRRIVREVVDAALANGWGAQKAARELRKRWQTLARPRSLLIARTEVQAAANYGSLTGARYYGRQTRTNLEKVWLATSDRRTRDTHRAANGQTRPIDEPFTINGKAMMQPGDPSGGASECVNCRCAVAFRVVD